MYKVYGLISDQHFHNWSAFSTIDENGVNIRLKAQLSELRRCADEVRSAGGNLIVNAGDTFHVRGKLAPSVLNPVLDLHRELISEGFEIIILAGNHDAELKEVTRLSSAITALEGVGCVIVNADTSVDGKHFIPWCQNIAELKDRIEAVDLAQREETDLFLHVPLDGVIVGIPDHGLTGEYLKKLGFRRVFCGHYHSHKEVIENKVWSIGASTHHTWSDVGSKAGFLIVHPDKVVWNSSRAPQFIEIDETADLDDLPLTVDGHFVKAKISSDKSADVETMRSFLIDECKAAGCVIFPQRVAAVTEREGAVISTSSSLEDTINSYITSKALARGLDLQKLCQEILTHVKAVA